MRRRFRAILKLIEFTPREAARLAKLSLEHPNSVEEETRFVLLALLALSEN